LLPEDLAADLSAILDEEISDEGLLKASERIVNQCRYWNV
jgi:hypothetical protein